MTPSPPTTAPITEVLFLADLDPDTERAEVAAVPAYDYTAQRWSTADHVHLSFVESDHFDSVPLLYCGAVGHDCARTSADYRDRLNQD